MKAALQSRLDSAPPAKVNATVLRPVTAVKSPTAAAILPGGVTARMYANEAP